MDCVRVTGEFGIVVRLASLNEQGIPLEKLQIAIETSSPFDSNAEIASFGPHFGAEALETLVRRLSDLGLKYFDDFFEFSGDFPKWCIFGVSAASAPEHRREHGHELSELARPTDAEVEAAARVLIKRGAIIIGGPKPSNRTMSLPRRTRSPRASSKGWWNRC